MGSLKRIGLFILIFICAMTLGAQNKTALLIANGNYDNLPSLNNPVPEAVVLGQKLESLGFQVTLLRDGSQDEMLDSLYDFEQALKEREGIAFFHYGGHAVQVEGKNYLMPANADIPDERRVKTRALDVDEVMASLDASGADTSIVILDACRNNPLSGTDRGGQRGLGTVGRKPANSIIVYSAESGTVARDGVFTPALIKHIAEPNVSFTEVLRKTRQDVYALTSGAQTPGSYDQLFQPIFLAGSGVAVAPVPVPEPVPEPEPEPQSQPKPQPKPYTPPQPKEKPKAYSNFTCSLIFPFFSGNEDYLTITDADTGSTETMALYELSSELNNGTETNWGLDFRFRNAFLYFFYLDLGFDMTLQVLNYESSSYTTTTEYNKLNFGFYNLYTGAGLAIPFTENVQLTLGGSLGYGFLVLGEFWDVGVDSPSEMDSAEGATWGFMSSLEMKTRTGFTFIFGYKMITAPEMLGDEFFTAADSRDEYNVDFGYQSVFLGLGNAY